jgi:hypothetical protein
LARFISKLEQVLSWRVKQKPIVWTADQMTMKSKVATMVDPHNHEDDEDKPSNGFPSNQSEGTIFQGTTTFVFVMVLLCIYAQQEAEEQAQQAAQQTVMGLPRWQLWL